MSIQNMHYDFKKKLNKVDSQKYRNLAVPEIDWVLNEAYNMFLKNIISPRLPNGLGFEVNQRSVEDIRTLVIEKHPVIPTVFDEKSYTVGLPENYKYLVSSEAVGTKGECVGEVLQTSPVQHDDRHEVNAFSVSSFEWRETNYRFFEGGLRFFTDGTFSIDKVNLDYVRVPKYIHFASGHVGGTYKLPSGVQLTGYQNCELPEDTHKEIVDLAVLITTGELQIPDYQIKAAKVKLND